jgi:predicted nuclease of predicted toxin-antitoxin system
MAVGLYMDVHIPRAITNGLRLRGVDVLTAQEDTATRLDDSELLDRATQLGRLIYTQDDDLLSLANFRIVNCLKFSGVIFSHQLRSPIGKCIEDLEIISKVFETKDVSNKIEFIPF